MSGFNIVGKITELETKHVFRSNTVLAGTSKSGKTTIIRAICRSLKGKFATALVYNPTDDVKKDYSDHMFPKACVKPAINIDDVYKVITRQLEKVKYKKAGQDYVELCKIVRKYVKNGNEIVESLENSEPTTNKSIRDKYREKAVKVLRKLVSEKLDSRDQRLDGFTRNVINHLHANIDLILIFDDVTEQLRKLMNAERDMEGVKKVKFFAEFITLSRHNFTTIIMSVHYIKNILPKGARGESIHNMIYVQKSIAIETLTTELGFKMSEIKDKLPYGDTPDKKYWVLLYQEGSYYHYKAKVCDDLFRVTSDQFFDYCQKFTEYKRNNMRNLL